MSVYFKYLALDKLNYSQRTILFSCSVSFCFLSCFLFSFAMFPTVFLYHLLFKISFYYVMSTVVHISINIKYNTSLNLQQQTVFTVLNWPLCTYRTALTALHLTHYTYRTAPTVLYFQERLIALFDSSGGRAQLLPCFRMTGMCSSRSIRVWSMRYDKMRCVTKVICVLLP